MTRDPRLPPPDLDMDAPLALSAVTERNAEDELLARLGRRDQERETTLRTAPLARSQIDLHRSCHCVGDRVGYPFLHRCGIDMLKVDHPPKPKW